MITYVLHALRIALIYYYYIVRGGITKLEQVTDIKSKKKAYFYGSDH